MVKGRSRASRTILVFFPVTMLLAMSVWTGGPAVAGDGGGSRMTPIEDWYVSEPSVVLGDEVFVKGNIFITKGAILEIKDSSIIMDHDGETMHRMVVQDGATLIVTNSTLDLEFFVAEPQASVSFEGGTVVRTKGRFDAW